VDDAAQEIGLLALVLFVPGFVFLDISLYLLLMVIVVGERRVHLSQTQRIFLEHLLRRVAFLVEVDDVDHAHPRVIDGRAASAHAWDSRDVRVHDDIHRATNTCQGELVSRGGEDWFRVVAPNRGALTSGTREDRLELLDRHRRHLVASAWEDLCRKSVHRIRKGTALGRPWEAVQTFLGENQAFAVDSKREKFLLTFNPGGYLIKIR
jgi:hypothetical protein